MKKISIRIIAVILFAVLICTGLSACQPVEKANESDQPSMFVQIEETGSWKIVYHRETKVMYAVSFGAYSCGTFTLLVNPDGSPMLYLGGNKQ